MKGAFGKDPGPALSRLIDLSLRFHNVNRVLEAKCGISIVQWSLLRTLLNMPAVSPLHLARATGVTPGTLSQTMTRLNKKKLLFLCGDPSDARKRMVSLTRLGREKLLEANRLYAEIFADISTVDDEVRLVDEYLKRLLGSRA